MPVFRSRRLMPKRLLNTSRVVDREAGSRSRWRRGRFHLGRSDTRRQARALPTALRFDLSKQFWPARRFPWCDRGGCSILPSQSSARFYRAERAVSQSGASPTKIAPAEPGGGFAGACKPSPGNGGRRTVVSNNAVEVYIGQRVVPGKSSRSQITIDHCAWHFVLRGKCSSP